MSEVTRILQTIGDGNTSSASELLPLVYDELRQLAAQKMAKEDPNHTLQATALVHEAYLRLIGPSPKPSWDSRGHFFAAAAEAMRRILVEEARRKSTKKRCNGFQQVEMETLSLASDQSPELVLDLDHALLALEHEDPLAAKVAKLRLFAGLTLDEAAEGMAISRTTAYRQWTYARAWLRAELGADTEAQD